MTNKKQPCNRRTCPVYKSAQESNETQTSWHTCISGSETFDETASADGFPDEVEETNSQMTLLQKVRDPEQFMIALQNIVVLAENLLAAIEAAVKEGANTLQRSISSVISPNSSVENVRENSRESRSIYCEQINVTVPVTFHIRPTVAVDWALSEPIDEEVGEPIEPIRTASISMNPSPRMMYFPEDSEEMEKKEPLPGPEGIVLLAPQELPLPQQKDLNLCTPCNCEKCPIYDSSNAVVCPQNCGCCDCPWRGNMDPNFCHRGVKICGCTQPSMNTPSSAKRCECLPNFDICACRDIAEIRHVELYGTEMYPDGLIKDRDGATQNDRNRDHTNLSNQPNIEASAGLRRQPAGPNENQQAKDDEKNKRSSTDQYGIPRGSYLSSERTGECCNVSSSPTLMSAGGSKKPLTRNGSALICFSTKFNDSSEEPVGGPPKYIFSEDYWAPNDSFKQHEVDGRSAENVLERSEQQKREELDSCIESLYGLRFTSKSPSFTCIASSTRNNSSSQNVETNHQEALQSNSSEEPIFYTPRDSSVNTLSTQKPTVSSDINPPYSVIETETTPRETKDDRLVQLLENIYELLQCMREDHRQRIKSDRSTKFETDESLNDLLPPPPPPSSPSIGGQQVQISSTPPFNIFISPIAVQRAEDFDIVDLSQYTVENQGMDLLEPPERDVECHQPTVGTQRLIPLDTNLLEMDSNFELDPQKESNKCQEYESSLEDNKRSGLCEEIQVKIEDFTVSEINSPTEGVSRPTAQFVRPSESQELKSGALTCCQQKDTLTEKHFPARKLETELCECVCKDPNECADTCCKFRNSISIENPSDHQNPSHVSSSIQIAHVKPEAGTSQEVQVNTDSLQSITPQSEQLPSLENTNAIPTAVTNVGTDRPQFDDEDPTTEPPICHCHQASAKPQKPDASDFIDSILYDLKAIKKIREKAARRPLKTGSQIHQIDLSFPVTIETVQELGPNSLFIKWKVHNCANIAGYEIFLDDRLTYRYFSRVHRAAVICNVNLQYPHIIILRAQPQLHTKPSSLACNSKLFTSATKETRTINAAESYPQPDGSIWYPSVFHFEPNFYSAPANTSLDDCCAAKC